MRSCSLSGAAGDNGAVSPRSSSPTALPRRARAALLGAATVLATLTALTAVPGADALPPSSAGGTPGPSAYAALSTVATRDGSADETALAALGFTPDGGSDSARIVIATDDEDRPWAAEIILNGADGTITSREFNTDQEPIENP